jgi:hypothetical protein
MARQWRVPDIAACHNDAGAGARLRDATRPEVKRDKARTSETSTRQILPLLKRCHSRRLWRRHGVDSGRRRVPNSRTATGREVSDYAACWKRQVEPKIRGPEPGQPFVTEPRHRFEEAQSHSGVAFQNALSGLDFEKWSLLDKLRACEPLGAVSGPRSSDCSGQPGALF